MTTQSNEPASGQGGAYRYGNTRPLLVFALAGLAALGASGTVGLAKAGLQDAREAHRLADPPDLRKVVGTFDIKDKAAGGAIATRLAARSEGE